MKWMLNLKPEKRPSAKEVIEVDVFKQVVKAGMLHPHAFKHQVELQRKLSPDSVMDAVIPTIGTAIADKI